MTYDEWVRNIDRILIHKCGLGRNELPDAPWRDWYEDGLSPQEGIENYLNDWDDMGLREVLEG